MSDNNIKIKGRPAIVSDQEFIEVHSKAESIDEVVKSFASLQDMEVKKARLYVSMRSSALRKKGFDLKMFPRGKKSSKIVPIME